MIQGRAGKYLGLNLGDSRLSKSASLLCLLKKSDRHKIDNNSTLAEFLSRTGLIKTPISSSEDFLICTGKLKKPLVEKRETESFQSVLELARKRGLIRDFVGITKRSIERKIIFSVAVGENPKPYLSMYLMFAAGLKKKIPGLEFFVHLESWLPTVYLENTALSQSKEKSIRIYQEYVEKFRVADSIFITSLSSGKIISQKFIEKHLSRITFSDFISLLPYQKHSIEKALLADLIHFIWNLYIVSELKGIYLTSINSKREFTIFRKALLGNPPVIFFPQAPELVLGPEDLEFYRQYRAFSGEF